jgi:iron complex transport system substrate-binding protein
VKYLISIVLIFFSLGFASSYPLELTDELGRTVTLLAEPAQIVSMLPSHTEMICALDACDKLIGIDDFSDYPPEVSSLPRLGGGLTGFDGGPNVEAIVALEPDLVLVSEYGELASLLESAGLTVYAGSPQSYEDTFDFIELLARLVNREVQADLLIGKIRGEVEAVASLTQHLPKPSVYFEVDATPYSVGPGSYIGVLIEKAGGANIVAADQGDYPQLDPEYIVAANPEVIILGDAPYGESAETLAARPGWAGLAALQTEGVYELSEAEGNMVGRPGPRLGEIVQLFAKLFHPELFR